MATLKPLPGPIGWPIVGSALSLGKNPTTSMTNWSKEYYGDVYALRIGSKHVVTVQGYDAMYEAMVEKGDDFLGRAQGDIFAAMRNNNGIFFAQHSQHWKYWRTFAKTELHDIMAHIRKSHVGEMKYALERLGQLADAGEPIDLGRPMLVTMGNTILQSVFSERLEEEDEDFERVVVALYEEVKSDKSRNLVFFPWLAYLPSFGRFIADADQRRKIIIGRLTKMIENHGYDRNKHDLVDSFYRENPSPDEQTIKSFAFLVEDIIFAGASPNKFAAMWALLFLMLNPRVMKKLQTELDSRLEGVDNPIATSVESNFEGLEYLKATVDESNRIRPVAVFREALKDTSVMGYKVHKGMLVFPNIWSVHHDEKIFPEPEKFKPERFINSRGKYQPSEHVIPFNMGPRKCPGYEVAYLGIRTYLLTLLFHFNVELVTPLTDADMEGKQQPASSPPDSKVKLTKRHDFT